MCNGSKNRRWNMTTHEHSLIQFPCYRRSLFASPSPVFPAPRVTFPSAPLSSATLSRRSPGMSTSEESKALHRQHHLPYHAQSRATIFRQRKASEKRRKSGKSFQTAHIFAAPAAATSYPIPVPYPHIQIHWRFCLRTRADEYFL